MAQYSDIFYQSADLRLKLYARDYGGEGPPVICMHGLSRNSADFSYLAAHLASKFRVIVPDQRGRGRSQWDDQPLNYNPAVYVQDMFKLIGELGLNTGVQGPALIGTSMGGIMAMIMGVMAQATFRGLVINDVGPEISVVALERLRSFIGKSPPINTWADAAARARETNVAAFPNYGDDDWMAFARRTYHEMDGKPVSSYDPAISGAFDPEKPAVAPPAMWDMWQGLMALPILGIRGALSDLLTTDTFTEMAQRHPGMQSVIVADVGHAPMLDEPEAVAAIDAFLASLM